MIDDLRDQTGEEFFIEEEEDTFTYEASPTPSSVKFLGMTPIQRFVIAVILLMIISVVGAFFLLVTGKLYLPIF